MKFKIIFRIDRSLGDCLPINYQYEQSAVIYKILSNADKAIRRGCMIMAFSLIMESISSCFAIRVFNLRNIVLCEMLSVLI